MARGHFPLPDQSPTLRDGTSRETKCAGYALNRSKSDFEAGGPDLACVPSESTTFTASSIETVNFGTLSTAFEIVLGSSLEEHYRKPMMLQVPLNDGSPSRFLQSV